MKIEESITPGMKQPSLEDLAERNTSNTLSFESAKHHLKSLNYFLDSLSVMLEGEIRGIDIIPDVQWYLHRLADTAAAMMLYYQIQDVHTHSEHVSPLLINSRTGFPLIIKDFQFLANDKEKAKKTLSGIPPDNELVSGALFSLFRGKFPDDIILQKYLREYFSLLENLLLPGDLLIHSAPPIKEENGLTYVRYTAERLDGIANLPRFYAMYLTVPKKMYPNPEWKDQLTAVIQQTLQGASMFELPLLARVIEDIEGVQLRGVERYDIGPFMNEFTAQDTPYASLLTRTGEGILVFQKSNVVRVGQQKKQGLGNAIKSWMSGDQYNGIFSPVITSPIYLLMPHRMIQQQYAKKTPFEENTIMIALPMAGGQ